jgi:hypothetical protein
MKGRQLVRTKPLSIGQTRKKKKAEQPICVETIQNSELWW